MQPVWPSHLGIHLCSLFGRVTDVWPEEPRSLEWARRRIMTYHPDTDWPIRGEDASDSGLKIIRGEGAKGPCPGSPKVKVPWMSCSSQQYSGGEDGPSSLERSTDSWCISQGFPHLKLANERTWAILNMSLVTLMLKPLMSSNDMGGGCKTVRTRVTMTTTNKIEVVIASTVTNL